MEYGKLVSITEDFVRNAFSRQQYRFMIAHDFKHVHRVRNRALAIAEGENYPEKEIVEITALLHDIGLAYIDAPNGKDAKLSLHAQLGAEIAAKFLDENSNLSQEQITLITDAIGHHSSPPSVIKEYSSIAKDKGKLLQILQDSDNLDALGAVGLMRAYTSKHFLPGYDPSNVKGDGWLLSPEEYREKYGFYPLDRLAPVNYISDQINQQIRYYTDNLHTETAKKLAEPLVQFMKDFMIQLENEITRYTG
jgi:uncharacterized protein